VNNPAKVLVGSALGASVGYGISKLLERETATNVATLTGEAPHRETLRERWARAQAAGAAAKVAKEEELRTLFRAKVKDPNALRETSAP
jgi:enoyl-[acyl-carrier-protein] reductase (NADH)